MLKVNFVSKQISVSEKNLLPASQDLKSSLRHLNKPIVTSNFAQKHLANRPKEVAVKGTMPLTVCEKYSRKLHTP